MSKLDLELCTAKTTPPKSAVFRKTADTRIRNYMGNKRVFLTDWIHKLEGHINPYKEERAHAFLSKKAFMDLVDILPTLDPLPQQAQLTGLRVYFASFKKTDTELDNHFLASEENLMTLIFHPTTAINGQPVANDIYYILSRTTTPIVKLNIPVITAFPWIQQFEEKAALLEKAPDNRPTEETRSIWFEGDSFLDWKKEIECMENANPKQPVLGLNMIFSAYDTAEQVEVNDITYSIGDQLTLIIRTFPSYQTPAVPNNLIKARPSGETFPPKITRKFRKALDIPDDGFDTSVPCPPAACDV